MRTISSIKPWPVIALHWLSGFLVLLMFAAIWWRAQIDEELPLAKQLLAAHKQIGVFILALLVVRLLTRLLTPRGTHDLPRLLLWAGRLSHTALYLCLLAMPLLGWSMSNAMGHTVTFLGVMPLPALIGIDPDLADSLQEWHETVAWVLLALVVLHVLAGLWHHFIRKDNTLTSMAPWLRPRV